MQDPQAHEILTVGAVLAAIYIGTKEFQELKELKGVKGVLPAKSTTVNAPRPAPIPGNDDDGDDGDASLDASQSCSKTKGTNPQEVISEGMVYNPLNWQPNCGSPSCQNFQAKVYCACWNTQPFYAGSAPGQIEQVPPASGKWKANGQFYNNNGSTYIQPEATTDPSKQKWSGGPVMINPALYAVYPYLAYESIKQSAPCNIL